MGIGEFARVQAQYPGKKFLHLNTVEMQDDPNYVRPYNALSLMEMAFPVYPHCITVKVHSKIYILSDLLGDDKAKQRNRDLQVFLQGIDTREGLKINHTISWLTRVLNRSAA